MPDINGFTAVSGLAAHPAVTHVLAVSKEDTGPGPVLRTVLLVGIAGVAFMAWFLLRGYRNKD